MCLPSTDFHDRPRPGSGGVDLVEQAPGQLGIAELVEILHSTHLVRLLDAGLLCSAGEPVAELLVENVHAFELREGA